MYTLLKKKCTFNSSIFPGDPRSGSVTLGHAQYFQCCWELLAKEPVQKSQTVLSVYPIVWIQVSSGKSQTGKISIDFHANGATIWNNSDYWVYWNNCLRFLDGVFCKLLPGAFKELGVTQGHWPWPRVIRKNRWILKRYVSFWEGCTVVLAGWRLPLYLLYFCWLHINRQQGIMHPVTFHRWSYLSMSFDVCVSVTRRIA